MEGPLVIRFLVENGINPYVGGGAGYEGNRIGGMKVAEVEERVMGMVGAKWVDVQGVV
ncbi:unnamed protein product [Sphenostylis stenocarpa]|uniref:Uncharacterized protein n=1 Tax=Sphenostylis stenocarpa TaxID=92480 RepID=A0AA86VU22_9FABA|nr:unnamed protein product [Sphenostylis stenocarpa]